jgi:8-oxo-dGTP pyrophosphatase MutT (NUDIX family)
MPVIYFFQVFTWNFFRKRTAMETELCNMCMISDQFGRVLVQERLPKPTSSWSGLTFPGGHIEPGETAKMTARREIEEETGLKNVSILTWLGKIHFKYRRADKLVLMTTQIYLVQALDTHEMPVGEKWMKGIRWFSFTDALETIEYDDIGKLMLIAKKRVRTGDY